MHGAADARVTRGAIAVLTLSLLVVALAAAAVVLALRVRAGAEAAGQRDAVLAAARQTAVNMFTVDPDDPKGSLDRLAGGATGDFRQQLTGQSDEFVKSLRDAHAGSQGRISEAGIRALADDQAAVLASATATVHNSEAPQGQTLSYRMVIELRRVDGVWLVSQLELVP